MGAMWYSKAQQYLRKNFTRSGRGFFTMGKSSANLVEVINVDANGSQQTTIADTSGNLAGITASQLNVYDAGAIAQLTAILAALGGAGGGPGSATQSTSATYTLTTSPVAIGSAACKQVTIYNATTSNNVSYSLNGGATLLLEPGYSATFPATNISQVSAWSVAGGEILYITYSA